MILPFSQKDKHGKPTFFKEKIFKNEKIHTIREDNHNRWKEGNTIQMAYNCRTKKYEQFNKDWNVGRKCVSTQYIDIFVTLHQNEPGHYSVTHEVVINDRFLKESEIAELAKNDGFDNIEDFKAWFNKDLRRGKIIHWTDKKY